MPGSVMYVYLGSLAGSVAALGTGARARTPGEWVLYTVGLLATVVLTVYITGKAQAAFFLTGIPFALASFSYMPTWPISGSVYVHHGIVSA